MTAAGGRLRLFGRVIGLIAPVSDAQPFVPDRVDVDVYAMVNELPPGPGRVAAWNAYALQTYGDKLTGCLAGSEATRAETLGLARVCYQLAAVCVECARSDSAPLEGERLPRWPTPLRSVEQLRGMRETLEVLRIQIAYELQEPDRAANALLADQLASIDGKLETVDRLWIKRPPAEIRGGVGDALMTGLDKAYKLGQQLTAAR